MQQPQASHPGAAPQRPPTGGGVTTAYTQQQQQLQQQQQQQQQQHQRQGSVNIAVSGGIPHQQAAAGGAVAPAGAPGVQQPSSGGNSSFAVHQGLNGGWQSDKDYQERRKMIAKIVHLLQQRKPNAPQEWLKKLPQMAKRLEESLYRSAKSFQEYNDASTLKNRLQQLAVNIGMKTKKMQQQQMMHQRQQQQQMRQSSTTSAGVPQQPQQQQQQLRVAPNAQQGQPLMVNMSEINPQLASPPSSSTSSSQQQQAALAAQQHRQQQQAHQQQQRQMSSTAKRSGVQGTAQQQFVQQQQQPHSQSGAVAPSSATAGAPASSGSASSGGNRQLSDRQQVLRHQQQRLLLLRHAAKCQHDDGRCPVTPHCAGMKRLWKHIAECKNQKCLVPHCVSSRYVLSHYHRCKDVRCPVCGPVREAIHRSHEKQKQMQALKQRHQQAVQQQQQQSQSSARPGSSSAAMGGSGVMRAGSVASAGAMPLSSQSSIGSEPPLKRQRKTSLTPQQQQAYQLQQQKLAQQRKLAMQQGVRPTGLAATQSGSLTSKLGVPTGAQVAQMPGVAFSNGQVVMPKHAGPKPQEDHTLINCFSVEEIETHIASLNKGLQLPPQKLKTKCLEVLKVLQAHQHGWVFNSPVDPVELGLPDYFEVIKKPMDLGTIRKKLENGVYHSLEEFEGHVHLTFDNAMTYNPEGSVVYNMASEMKEKFKQDYAKLIEQLNAEEDVKRRNGEACSLCGCEKLLFEPPIFYCNGLNCPSKRIRRNSYYYVGGNNQYHWCHQCYQELKDNSNIDLGDISIRKESLVKKKNDEVHEESWVQCDRCERWVHQICALFNTRQNKDQRSEYACPKCTILERKKKGNLEATSTTPMAEDLPRTLLSEYLENAVRQKMEEFLEKKARDKVATEGITLEEARKKVEMGGAITIRQVTSMDRKLEVRERMRKRYAFKNYPEEFNFRCKCIVVFQKLDAVDVILFGLYVYEHNEKNPMPNQRTVYVSYLDSVHYMRPRQMRTFIYHEILISYLDYVRRRGFATAHIWACPPLKGDDYILYAKPEDQKTPRDDRLRQWYVDMLVEAQRRGIVGKMTNMYDLYFKDPKNDATVVPYMDGDYFPAEAENIIKDIEEGKSSKKGSSQGKKKDKKVKKKKSGRGGTRSTGLDEEALRASGFVPPGSDNKPLEEGGRDLVMQKLGETIHPMKESFLVAFLAWEGAKEENMVVPRAIQEYRDQHGITWKLNDEKKADADKDANETAKSSDGSEKAPAVEKSDDAGGEKQVKEEDKPSEGQDESKQSDGDVEMKDATDPKEDEEGRSESNNSADDVKKDPQTTLKEESQTTEEKPESVKNEPTDKDAAKADAAEPTAEPADSNTEVEPAEPGSSTEREVKSEPKNSDSDPKGGDPEDPKKDPPADDSKGNESPSGTDVPVKDEPGTDSTKTENKETSEVTEPKSDDPRPTEDEKPEDGEKPDEKSTDQAATNGETTPDEPMPDAENVASKSDDPPTNSASEQAETTDSTKGPSTDQTKAPEATPEGVTSEDKSDDKVEKTPDANLSIRQGKFAAMAARKRDREGSLKPDEKEGGEKETEKDKEGEDKSKRKEPKTLMVKDSKGNMVKVIDDDEEELDCEFLNNRQAFLNLCQGNHYQFDYLRRAKHSSMMVLWHLHNRDAPKFVQQCATCSREILAGYRFHCATCGDFDQCQECVQNPKIPRHPHQLKPMPIGNGQQSELTAAQRKERQRSIQLHMTLLRHAATCNSAKCPSANCTKMKGLLKHGAQCQIKATGGCNVCKRIWALLQIHARQCKDNPCPVPNCMAIRERFRQLKKQQQAMDDRRRLEMNRAYRGKR